MLQVSMFFMRNLSLLFSFKDITSLIGKLKPWIALGVSVVSFSKNAWGLIKVVKEILVAAIDFGFII